MNNKVLKIVSTILMVMMIVSIAVTSFAAGALTPDQVTGTQGDNGKMLEIGQKIVGFLQAFGIILSVIILIIIGIKYMMGSAEEKAEYKKTLMPYFIGAVLIFAASAFAQAIYSFVSNF